MRIGDGPTHTEQLAIIVIVDGIRERSANYRDWFRCPRLQLLQPSYDENKQAQDIQTRLSID
jgi:hypothetical protein